MSVIGEVALSALFEALVSKLCREFNQNSQPMRNKINRENTRQRKIITRTKQYLRGSAICLRPRSCRDFTIIRENTIVHKNTLKKPKSQLHPSTLSQKK